MDEELRRAGNLQTEDDAQTVLPVLLGWLDVIQRAKSVPDKPKELRHGQEASRPRWLQPPLVVWNALSSLLPFMAASVASFIVGEVPGLLTTVVSAATGFSQHQCVRLPTVLRQS